jgi:hypothetical protein
VYNVRLGAWFVCVRFEGTGVCRIWDRAYAIAWTCRSEFKNKQRALQSHSASLVGGRRRCRWPSRHQHHTASRTTASLSQAIEFVRRRKLSRRSQDLLRQPHHRQLLQHPPHGLARTTEECTKLEAADSHTSGPSVLIIEKQQGQWGQQ